MLHCFDTDSMRIYWSELHNEHLYRRTMDRRMCSRWAYFGKGQKCMVNWHNNQSSYGKWRPYSLVHIDMYSSKHRRYMFHYSGMDSIDIHSIGFHIASQSSRPDRHNGIHWSVVCRIHYSNMDCWYKSSSVMNKLSPNIRTHSDGQLFLLNLPLATYIVSLKAIASETVDQRSTDATVQAWIRLTVINLCFTIGARKTYGKK